MTPSMSTRRSDNKENTHTHTNKRQKVSVRQQRYPECACSYEFVCESAFGSLSTDISDRIWWGHKTLTGCYTDSLLFREVKISGASSKYSELLPCKQNTHNLKPQRVLLFTALLNTVRVHMTTDKAPLIHNDLNTSGNRRPNNWERAKYIVSCDSVNYDSQI